MVMGIFYISVYDKEGRLYNFNLFVFGMMKFILFLNVINFNVFFELVVKRILFIFRYIKEECCSFFK